MPELPEVEAARLLADRALVGRRIVGVTCVDDPIVFDAVSRPRLRRALLGRKVLAAHRHGKHLWLELDQRPWPCFHFGMTGGLHTPDDPGVKLVSSGNHARRSGGARKRPSWPPRFTRLCLRLDDGGEVAFADARRLGRVRLRHDPSAEPPISLLGFDALRSIPPVGEFRERLTAKGAPMKAVLLDQSFAAGVGNWIADEVLYQARIDPRRPARTLSDAEVRRVRVALRTVIETAVRVGSDGDRFPRTWLFHRRWGRAAGATTARGESIRHDTIGGRTTAWAPARQR
jgi:formamidopyrimidine-DNA glycosylase